MSMLELGGKRYPIPMGDAALGSDPACVIALTGPGLLPKHALLQGQTDGQVVIRKAAPEAEVMINGVRLGAEPTPLLHGDKLQVAGHELTFVDERRSGSTQYVPAMAVPGGGVGGVGAKPAGSGKSVGTTGGRLVSLTDGREYTIVTASLVLGREAGCDVVVPGKDVSRRHAEIVASPKGYLLVDSSTNGVFVNDERIQGQHLLARGDVIRIGEESFRFYSEQAAPAPAPSAPAPAPSAPAAAPAAPAPPPSAAARLQNTSFGMPATPRPTAPVPNPAAAPAATGSGAPLANFLVRSGLSKGQRLIVRTPIANIGRADYNDLILTDESVSTSHAKLQRREGVWTLVDLESTNGTYVDGERISTDTPIAPGTMVRFGDVQLVFEPTDDALGVAKGGGTKVLESFKVAPPAPPPPPRAAAAPAPAGPPKAASRASPTPKAAAPPKPAAPAKRPPPKASAAPPPDQKKQGKGCGGGAAVIVLVSSALIYWILV